MTMTYTIDSAARLVRLHNATTPTYAEWERCMLEVFADPAYEPGFAFLGDGRGLPPSEADMVRRTITFASAHRREFETSRWAVVVDTPAMYGMSRMGQSLGASYVAETRIFDSVEAAESWLLGKATQKAAE
jgi:hypothetical protein